MEAIMAGIKKTKGLPWGETATFADLLKLFAKTSVGLECGSNFFDSAYTTMSYYLARMGEVDLAVETALKITTPFWRVLGLAQVATLHPAQDAGRAALAAAADLARDEGLLERGSARITAYLGAAKALAGNASAAEELFEAGMALPSLATGSEDHPQRQAMVIALTRAGHGDRACAVLGAAASSALWPGSWPEALVDLFEEGHTETAIRLLELSNKQFGRWQETPSAAAIRALINAGRHHEAAELLDRAEDFGVCPYRIEVLESWAASGDQGMAQAVERLEVLGGDLSTSDASTYLMALSALAPDRCGTHLSAQIDDLQMRSQTDFAREVARVAARLGQGEALVGIEDSLRFPGQLVAVRSGLAREGIDFEGNVKSAMAFIDNDAAMSRHGSDVEESRRDALSQLGRALFPIDQTVGTDLFDRVRESILKAPARDRRYLLASLQGTQVSAGDLDGALATLMKQKPADRLSEYNSLLKACADRGELAVVIAVVKKLKNIPGQNDRAEAVVLGFERAARAAING
jgi:hypothetical protein